MHRYTHIYIYILSPVIFSGELPFQRCFIMVNLAAPCQEMQQMVVDQTTREYMEQNIEFIDWWGDQLRASIHSWGAPLKNAEHFGCPVARFDWRVAGS